MSEYRCPVCHSNDPTFYVNCQWPGCPDGRDPRPAASPSPPASEPKMEGRLIYEQDALDALGIMRFGCLAEDPPKIVAHHAIILAREAIRRLPTASPPASERERAIEECAEIAKRRAQNLSSYTGSVAAKSIYNDIRALLKPEGTLFADTPARGGPRL